MPSGTYIVAIDWSGGTAFTGANDDVTARTLRAEFQRGRDVDSQLTGKSVAGIMRLVLNNQSGDYNSFNASSPLSGSLLPGRQVLLRATGPTAGTLWRGYIDRIVPQPSAKGLDTAVIECIGPLGRIADKEISMPIGSGIRTGTAVGTILDKAGWPTGTSLRDIDDGETTMTRFWIARKKALDALREVEDTESGFIRESGAGKIIFEDRQRRMSSPFTTSQATFTDDTSGSLVYNEIQQEDPLPFVFDEFSGTVWRFTAGATGTLWILPGVPGSDAPEISPNSGTRKYVATYPNPTATMNAVGVDSWITPTATTDWTTHSDRDGTGTELTGSATLTATAFGGELEITITNTSDLIMYLTKLQARGVPLLIQDPTVVRATATTGTINRTFPSKAKWVPDVEEAKDWTDWNLAIYQDPTKRLSMTFIANRSTAHLNQAILREVSDRVTVVATSTRTNLGINADFYIESMKHVIEADRTHTVTYYLSEAKQFSDGWTVGVSALGTNTRVAF